MNEFCLDQSRAQVIFYCLTLLENSLTQAFIAVHNAMGLSPETYDREERRAAFAILNAVERIDRDEPLLVPSSSHELLANHGAVLTQIDEVKERNGLDRAMQRESEIER